MEKNQWDKITVIMKEKSKILEKAGCDAIMICSNTMHKIVPQLEKTVSIPILHVVDAVGNEIQQKGLKTVLLLGTKSTMEGNFYQTRTQIILIISISKNCSYMQSMNHI